MKQKILAITLVILMISMGVPLDFAVTYKTASVVEVTGVVSILKAGGEQTFTPEVGMTLEHGDRIITGKGASIALEIDADKYIKVGEKTYMSLSELMSEAESGGDSTDIKLFTGKVWASLSKPLEEDDSFEIETPTAVMGAKGTKFFVKYVASSNSEQDESSNTELVVLEGKVSMGTQVENKSEGEGPSVVQDVEFMANANETLFLDPELIQGVSSEIENRLNAGETIDQINIQDVVSKVGKAKQIEVKNLDLFVLEIVADDPGEYDHDLTDGLDQLIEQKKLEAPEEENQEEGPPNILYGQISGNNGAGSPVVPGLPEDNGNRAGAPSGGGTHDNGNETTPLYVTNVKVVDAVLDDGIADHMIITFNQPVDDATYVPSSGAQLASEGALGDIDTSEISYGEVPNLEDSINDATLVFSLDTEGKTVNTSPTGYFSIPNAGMIEAISGVSLGAVSALAITDNIAPVVLGARVSLEGAAQDKYMKLIYSEPIYDLSSNLWDNVRLAATVQIAYSDAQPIGYVTKSHTGTYSEANQLDYPTVDYIRTAFEDNEGYEEIVLKMNSSTNAYISDESGNKRYLQKDIQLLDFIMDTQNTKVSDVTVETLTENTDYLFTIKLDDYLSVEQMNTLINSPESFLQGTFSTETASFTDVSYQYESIDQITLNFHVNVLDGALVNNDAITINYAYLYDLSGHSVTDYYDDAVQTMRTYYYEEAGDTWTMEEVIIPLYAEEVATIDADGNGLVDHLRVTFNLPVDDSTFVAENGISLQSLGSLDPVDDTSIITNLSGDYTDIADDEVIYLKLDHTQSDIMYNTGSGGTLEIPSGTLKSLENALDNQAVDMVTEDKAAPVIIEGTYAFDGTRDEKVIKLVASEPLISSSFDTPDFRILNNDTSLYDDASPVEYVKIEKNQGSKGNETRLSGLGYDTLQPMIAFENNAEDIYLYFDDTIIADESGNQTALTGEKVKLSGSILDNDTTSITDVGLVHLDGNKYRISLTFNDYLDPDIVEYYAMELATLVIFYGDDGNNMTITDHAYNASVSGDVTFSFDVQLATPLLTMDRFSIDLTLLQDYRKEQTYITNEGVDRTRFNLVYDESNWTFNSPYLSLLEANTVDYDRNGKIDFIQLVFDEAVDDTSFSDVGATINSTLIASNDVNTSEIAFPAGLDSPDDTTIYFAVSEGDVYNTAAEGTLDIPSSGMIQDIYQRLLPATNGVHINDGVGPMCVDSEIDLSLPYDEKYISLTFSEPLDEAGSVEASALKLSTYTSDPIVLRGTTEILDNKIFVKPLLGSVEDEEPSFISVLSKYLYGQGVTASISLEDGSGVSSAHGESYELPDSSWLELSSIQRINEFSKPSDVTVVPATTGSSIILVTYSDYLESYNEYFSEFITVSTEVTSSNLVIESQAIAADHKSLELMITGSPGTGDTIQIMQARNITNSFADDENETTVFSQMAMILFDGTEWRFAPY